MRGSSVLRVFILMAIRSFLLLPALVIASLAMVSCSSSDDALGEGVGLSSPSQSEGAEQQYDDGVTEATAGQHLSASQQLSDHEQGIFHYERGLDRLKASDYDNAVADMDKARKLIDPQQMHMYTRDMHEVYFQSGIAYYDTGLYDDATRLFDKAIDVVASPSDYPAAYFHRGMSHYRKGSHRRAIADFDMLVGLEQDYPDAAHYRRLAREKLSE